MKFADLVTRETPQKILIYGAPKTGKTALAATLLSEGYKLIWFDVEKGIQTLVTHVEPELYPNIEVIQITDTKETHLAIETCIKVMSGKPYKICETHGKIACGPCTIAKAGFTEISLGDKTSEYVVVFDSLSQISDSAKNASTKDLDDLAKLEFKHYERIGMYLSLFLGAVQQAPFHVCCISHADMAEDVDGKEKIFPVGGTRNFSKRIAKYFDHVVYTTIVNKKFVVASSAAYNPRITIGSRSDLAMETGNVSLGDLLKAKAKIGGGSMDIEEEQQKDGTTTPVVKQHPLLAKMAAKAAGK